MEGLRFVTDPELNKEVVPVVAMLRDNLISAFNPKSIIVSASFACGEALAVKENGRLRFLSDCEVAIIPNWHIFSRKRMERFAEQFYEATKLKAEVSGVTLSLYLALPGMSRRIQPTMDNYNIKHGAKLLYGRDYLSRMPDFRPQDIPLWEGVRLMFNRMAEAMVHFDAQNPSLEMVFWTDKIILACQDALLLSRGRYHHTYRERNRMFRNLIAEKHEESGGIPDFRSMADEATGRRLSGVADVQDPVGYWFDVMEICDVVFSHIISEYMGVTFGDYLDFQDKYVRGLKVKPADQFRHALKKFLTSRKLSSSIAILRTMKPRDHIIYSLIPLLYFGLSRDMSVNHLYLERVIGCLSSLGALGRDGKAVDYDTLRRRIYYELIG